MTAARDLVMGGLSVLLLEASRRAEGPWMPIIAIVALLYVFLGPYLPGLMAHRGSCTLSESRRRNMQQCSRQSRG